MQFSQKLENKIPWLGNALILLVIIFLGAFLRFQFIHKSPFPMNDGGFFYVMIRDLQQNDFKLPRFTTYNFINIPYAYPPLSLYEAGWLNQFLNIDLYKVFLYYPLFFNLLSIPAFYFLSREFVKKNKTALLATVIYAILSPGYEWLVSGGGLTRSPAHTLFIISLTLFLIYLRTSRKWILILSIVSGAVMTLHHIEYCWLMAYSVILFTFLQCKNIKGILKGVFIVGIFGLGIALLTSVYWIPVLKNHNLQTFLSAFSTGEINLIKPIRRLLEIDFTGASSENIISFLAVIGVFVLLLKKDFTLPLWLMVMVFLSFRSAYRTLLFPVSILSAIALVDLLMEGLNQLELKTRLKQSSSMERPPRFGIVFGLFCLASIYLLGYVNSLSEHRVLSSINLQELAAMDWTRENTSPDSTFLIVNPSIDWYVDRVGEWFPAVAERHSATTLQGMEWLPNQVFNQERWYYSNFKQCISNGVDCLFDWAEQTDTDFTHLFISKSECQWNTENCTNYFILTVEDSSRFTKVFENAGVVIYEQN